MDPNILGNFRVCIGVPLIIAGWRPGLRVGDSVYSGAAAWNYLSWLAYFTSLGVAFRRGRDGVGVVGAFCCAGILSGSGVLVGRAWGVG